VFGGTAGRRMYTGACCARAVEFNEFSMSSLSLATVHRARPIYIIRANCWLRTLN